MWLKERYCGSLELRVYGEFRPTVSTISKPDEIAKARTFMVNDAKANYTIRRRVSPLLLSKIPGSCDNSARETWKH